MYKQVAVLVKETPVIPRPRKSAPYVPTSYFLLFICDAQMSFFGRLYFALFAIAVSHVVPHVLLLILWFETCDVIRNYSRHLK